ncbi:MAG: cytochrome c [Rhodothermaceae bacterium]|nr:cytochrome c [Rhodothermaceae bacterium]MXX57997.1 cytochrome c [Rhodothermaceae bacterium]MYD19842.1 cytochrome c [Rhodothermaceae bacterium]MYD57470.1 cytochrome c [Rhodothermaceae bacterium]MYI44370.1 cytochrome c [Rhodothermaceae bacterium]
MRITLRFVGVLLVVSACARPNPEMQQALGETVYAAYCQSCHEAPGTGPRLTPAILASRLTADRLYTYNQQQMPYDAGGILSNEDYLNVTAWLLYRASLIESNKMLTMRNMDEITLIVTETSPAQ